MANLFVKISLFLLVITIPFYVSAFPTGAGTCDVDAMATQGHGKSSAQDFSTGGGYTITTTKSGQQISISITGKQSVEGVLIYTQDSQGNRIGTFAVPSGYQSKQCSGNTVNTLTHTNQNLKNMPINFMWTPPSGSSGNVTVRGIVVQNFANWLKLKDVSFDPSSGASSVSNATITQSGSGAAGSDGTDGGIGSWFKNYLLFIILMIIVIILYIVSSVTETMLRNQRAKAKNYRN